MKQKILSDCDGVRLTMVEEPVLAERPCFLVVHLESTEHWGDQPPYKYHIEILAASPKWIGNKELQSAAETHGISLKDFKALPVESQVQIIVEYGIRPVLWREAGNNKAKLLAAANEQLPVIHAMFGFYMDRPQNAIGDTGWDWIRGQLCAGISR